MVQTLHQLSSQSLMCVSGRAHVREQKQNGGLGEKEAGELKLQASEVEEVEDCVC